MEALLKTGKTKAIGISNFSKKELDRILDECDVVPAAHQFELHPWFVPPHPHPFPLCRHLPVPIHIMLIMLARMWVWIRLQQNEFSKYNQSKGIIVTCYSPFGNQNEIYDKGKNMGKLMDEPVLVEIGKKYGKNGAQTALGTSLPPPFSLPLHLYPYPVPRLSLPTLPT